MSKTKLDKKQRNHLPTQVYHVLAAGTHTRMMYANLTAGWYISGNVLNLHRLQNMEHYYGTRGSELLVRRVNRHTYRWAEIHTHTQLSQLKEVDFVRYTFFVGHFLPSLMPVQETDQRIRRNQQQEERKDTGGTLLFLWGPFFGMSSVHISSDSGISGGRRKSSVGAHQGICSAHWDRTFSMQGEMMQ